MPGEVRNEMTAILRGDVEPYRNDLLHYGVKRRSGRYPWGSGENPYQHSGDFLSRYNELKKQGISEKEIMAKMGVSETMGTVEFRTALKTARHEQKQLKIQTAKRLAEKEGLGPSQIGRKMGESESTIRGWLKEDEGAGRRDAAMNLAKHLKAQIDEKGMIDVGADVEKDLGVSRGVLDEAIYLVEAEYGYSRFGIGLRQATNKRQQTNMMILADPKYDQNYAYNHPGEIQSLHDYTSEDGGKTFKKAQYPESISSDRVAIRYAEDGGKNKDGLIEIRRGVEDLDLGNSHYAQVRILVDGDRYLKGMAMYSDDLPDGVDVMFNTNKTKDVAKRDVMKETKDDPDDPFGAAIKAAGQSTYIGADGKEHLSAINKLKQEGDWEKMDKNLSSQFLSKQPEKLIRQQLDRTIKEYRDEYDEIMSITNPTIKRQELLDLADTLDGAAVHMKAAALPRQTTQVLIPLTGISDDEVYAPSYQDGERLALIRYPHGGTFEIPIVTVNNKNRSGRRAMGNDIVDAIGISAGVAERLSGADFDGDQVVAIPITSQSNIKSKPALKELEGFDPKTQYAVPSGNPNNVRIMKKGAQTQKEMGIISNLITDMTLQGAPDEEIARAVKHSMVVIDAAKHKLDYRQSELDNGIAELKQKWQTHIDDETGEIKVGGASTLLSKRKQTVRVPERQGSGWIDPDTGEMHYRTSGRKYKDPKTGEYVDAVEEVSKILNTDDVRKLSSGTVQETLYADFSNELKNMANMARKSSLSVGLLKKNKEAAEEYSDAVASLNKKLMIASANSPRERRAQAIANSVIKAKIQDNDLDAKTDSKEIKKLSQQALENARAAVGASSKDKKISISDREWDAIQKGAISDNKLRQILRYADTDNLRKRATPRSTITLTTAKISKAQAMLDRGYSYADIAAALGVPKSTIYDNLNKI